MWAGLYWPEISGDYNFHSGQDLAIQDQSTFLCAVYAYVVSHPNEFRNDVRKGLDEFLSDELGEGDGTATEVDQFGIPQDDRPILDQINGKSSLMDQMSMLESAFAVTPSTPEPAPDPVD